MYEVGTSRSVRALHVMPGMPLPEGELHAHDYRLDVVVRREELDDRGMVCDLDVLEAALGEAVDELDGRDLEMIRPPDADAVTVEVFAKWLYGVLADPIRNDGGELMSVRVWESPTAFGGYTSSL